VRDGVVAHVDGRVTEGLDEELLVLGDWDGVMSARPTYVDQGAQETDPWNARAETVRSRASPLLEPGEDALEAVPGLGEVGVHLGDEAGRATKVSDRRS